MALLEVDKLSIGYQTRRGFLRAVESVSFSLEEGRSLGLVGESGCGKTTLGMALISLLSKNAKVTGGQIRFRGRDLLRLSEDELRKVRWKEIAMIFQAAMNALNPVHRVNRQIVEAILTHEPETTRADALKQVETLFRLVGIPGERMADYPHQYSGGMKQRAIIAMALSCRPSLIVADEPTTALDVIVQAQILEEIKKIQKELYVAILFISHDIAVVADVCHDIGVMFAGRLVEYGSRKEVFQSPVHPYTRALLSAYLTLDDDGTMPMPLPGNPPDMTRGESGCGFCDRCPESMPRCRQKSPEWIRLTPTHRALCCGIDPGRTHQDG
jgi:peptide/nickel transport system ATP-binding protein